MCFNAQYFIIQISHTVFAGGYVEHVFVAAAKSLFGVDTPDLNYTVKRNNDLQELTLTVDGQKKLKFALAYGFRNIQNIVPKIKQKRCPYDLVEIMACPSGKEIYCLQFS